MNAGQESRRQFLKLGCAASSAASALGIIGCSSDPEVDENSVNTPGTSSSDQASAKADFELWKKLVGPPYERGEFEHMPGVCRLPGPMAKRNWPDREKYRDVTKVPGMCQLCSSVCGIMGYVKDGRVVKIEGNPNDPNSRGHLCARGHAGLNHLYHPERLLYPLRRVGKRGEGKWKRISWDEALDEIAAKLKTIRESGKPEEFAFHQGRQRSKDAFEALS